MLYGLYGDIQGFRYLVVGHAVTFRHEKDFAATVGQGIDGLPDLRFLLGAVDGFFITDDLFQVGRVDVRHFGMLSAERVDARIAYKGIEESTLIGDAALISMILLPEFHKTVLHDILTRCNVTLEIMGGIEAQRPIISFEKNIEKHES